MFVNICQGYKLAMFDCDTVRYRELLVLFAGVGARTLLGAPGIASSNKCLTTSNKKLVETRSL